MHFVNSAVFSDLLLEKSLDTIEIVEVWMLTFHKKQALVNLTLIILDLLVFVETLNAESPFIDIIPESFLFLLYKIHSNLITIFEALMLLLEQVN